MHSVSDTPTAVEFGRFRILPHRRELLADSQPVELGGRAFDVLMLLIEARGAVVRKEILMRHVWPTGLSMRTICQPRSPRCERHSARIAT
jgi:DNA-binding winged helix-turn-helix (wHTH) protein